MRQLSPIEREKAKQLKFARTLIGAIFAAARDDCLNDELPALELEIDKAIQGGKSHELDVKALVARIEVGRYLEGE